MSLAPHKIDALIKEGKFWAHDLKYIKERSDQLLIAILIGNNLVNTFTAAFATVIATNIAASSQLEASTAVWVATWVITFLLLVFGEIAPKSFAIKNWEKISLLVAKFYRILMFLLRPIIFLLEKIIQLLTWKDKPETISDGEIEAFIDMSRNSGSLEQKQHRHLRNMLEFGDITVEEIMTPRIKVEALDHTTTIDEALQYYLDHTHSRIPVYHDTIDKITHILTIRDLMSHQNRSHAISTLKLQKPMKVPLNQPIDKLLESFQKNHTMIAIVIDEYGGVAGIVTLEDVVEEIFGEIRDETDRETEEIQNKWQNVYEVDSTVWIEDVLYLYDLEFSDFGRSDDKFDGETVSYVLTTILERFPKKQEMIKLAILNEDEESDDLHLSLTVLEVDDGNIGKVEVRKSI